MNAIKSSRFILGSFSRIIRRNVRLFSSGKKLVDVEVDSKTGVSTVKMQRPPVNSLSLELVTELTNTLIQVEEDKCKGLIITSSFPGVFTAGLDIMELYKPNQDRMKAYWTAIQDMWLHLYSSSCPTVAAILGHSPGAGCLIACSCDHRVMVEGNYTIGLNETQLGLPVPSWFVDTFRNIVPKRISEMALISGKLFKVDEALKAELIDEVASDDKDALARAAAYIAKLSKFSHSAMAQTKMTIRYEIIKRLQSNRENDIKLFVKFVSSPEIQKRLEMYLEALKSKK